MGTLEDIYRDQFEMMRRQQMDGFRRQMQYGEPLQLLGVDMALVAEPKPKPKKDNRRNQLLLLT